MNALKKLKNQLDYHQQKLDEYKKVYKLVQENPQMEEAMERLLDALESVNII